MTNERSGFHLGSCGRRGAGCGCGISKADQKLHITASFPCSDQLILILLLNNVMIMSGAEFSRVMMALFSYEVPRTARRTSYVVGGILRLPTVPYSYCVAPQYCIVRPALFVAQCHLFRAEYRILEGKLHLPTAWRLRAATKRSTVEGSDKIRSWSRQTNWGGDGSREPSTTMMDGTRSRYCKRVGSLMIGSDWRAQVYDSTRMSFLLKYCTRTLHVSTSYRAVDYNQPTYTEVRPRSAYEHQHQDGVRELGMSAILSHSLSNDISIVRHPYFHTFQLLLSSTSAVYTHAGCSHHKPYRSVSPHPVDNH